MSNQLSLTWDSFLNTRVPLYENPRVLSEELLSFLKIAYIDFNIDVSSYFKGSCMETDEYIKAKINQIINKMHAYKFHNVGKHPFKKILKDKDIPEWLKQEILYIQLLKNKVEGDPLKDSIHPSRKRIAELMNYIDENETDKESIRQACRKVTDNNKIIKSERKTFIIDQRHRESKKGSYMVIRADWMTIIKKYQETDENAPGSIRFRKSIRYRAISFIAKKLKSASDKIKANNPLILAINKLIDIQKTKYLSGLINHDREEFIKKTQALFDKIKSMPHMKRYDPSWISLRFIKPIFKDENNIIIEVNDDYVHSMIANNVPVELFFEEYHEINLTIKPVYDQVLIG